MLKMLYPEFYSKYSEFYLIKVGNIYKKKPKLVGNWYSDQTFKYIDNLFN